MNIFIKKNWEVRIGDFGIAKALQTDASFASTMTGTPFYLSPEMCEELPYDQKSDVWALGCLLYEMCCQTQPFKSEGYKGLKKVITKGRVFKLRLMSRALSEDPGKIHRGIEGVGEDDVGDEGETKMFSE
jgi:NIMA (never in mitosis gene a)-related kinase